jgi:serine/threonine-protein kinase
MSSVGVDEAEFGDATVTSGGDAVTRTRLSSDLDDSVLSRFREPDLETSAWIPPAGWVLDGKYRLEGTLGRGGAGIVFGARHVESDRPVAIKWMLPRDNQLRLRQRFVQEARAAGRLQHPNIIDVHDVVSSESGTYLVMERLEGESLRARLKRGLLPPEEGVAVCIAILKGLAEAHRLGVIHRDLKPENVFLCAPPREGVKVLDFGICAIDEHLPSDRSELTRTGEFVGTPVYTALERLREHHPFDHRVDLYSVGVILYETITGELPYAARSVAELTYQLTTAAPRPPRDFRPIDAHLEQVILRALSREPEDRFPDAAAFIAALEAPPRATRGSRVPSERGRLIPFASGLVVLCVLAAAVFAAARATKAPSPSRASIPAPARPAERAPESTRSVVDSAARAKPPDAPKIDREVSTVSPARAPRRSPVARNEPRPVPPANEERGSLASEGSATPAPAHLNVVVVPYGDVWVDGTPFGPSPQHIAIAAGRHVIAGGRTTPDQSTSILLSPGDSRKVIFGEPQSADQKASER